jgi:hypothetical protein
LVVGLGNSQYPEYLDVIDEIWAKQVAITGTLRDAPSLDNNKNLAREREEPPLLH